METRARFVLIGLVTLVGFLAAMGFVLWLAKVEIDRTYAQYDIVFDTVAGLGQAGAVRYNGVDVGRVLTIALDRTDPSKVRVRIEIFASTPVREDTVATLASQGVTGVSFVALEGGSAEAARLVRIPPAEVPVIVSENSVVQDLMGDAPDLLAQSIALIAEVRTFVTPENQKAVAAILQDLKDASGRIDTLATRAEATLTAAETTLARLDNSLGHADDLMTGDLPAMVKDAASAVDRANKAMAGLQAFAQGDLPQVTGQAGRLLGDAQGTVAAINGLVRQIASDPGRFLLGNQTPEYRN